MEPLQLATPRAGPDLRAAHLEELAHKPRLVTTPRAEAWGFCVVAEAVASAEAPRTLEFNIGRYASTACGLVVPIGPQPDCQPRPGDQRA